MNTFVCSIQHLLHKYASVAQLEWGLLVREENDPFPKKLIWSYGKSWAEGERVKVLLYYALFHLNFNRMLQCKLFVMFRPFSLLFKFARIIYHLFTVTRTRSLCEHKIIFALFVLFPPQKKIIINFHISRASLNLKLFLDQSVVFFFKQKAKKLALIFGFLHDKLGEYCVTN